jgi:quercetin dioxygenase-like cupin family protein
MEITEFFVSGERTEVRPVEARPEPLEFDGRTLQEILYWKDEAAPEVRIEVVELSPGADLPMHAGEGFAFCQVVSGKGAVGLPGGDKVPFAAPELLLFEAGSQHSWCDIEEHTVLTICVVGVS